MRRLFFFAGAIVLAAMLLAMGNRSAPTVSADPATASFDINMVEASSPGNANCANDGDNKVESNECPKVVTTLRMDTNGPGTRLDEPYFDLATTIWRTTGSQSSDGVDQDGDGVADSGFRNIPTSGLRATPGALINEGAIVGKIDFSIHSNLLHPADNNIDTDDGQSEIPSVSVSTPPKLVASLNLLEAETSSAILVSHTDVSPENAKNDSQEDNLNAAGGAGPNGIPDGADVMPEPIPARLDALGLPEGAFEGRGFGLAKLASILGNDVYVDVNFLIINLVAEGDGYISYTLVQYTFVPTSDPAPMKPGDVVDMTVNTGPPFSSDVAILAVSEANNTKYLPTYTANPTVAGGEINRQIVSGSSGSFDYLIFNSTDEDVDGDNVAAAYDLCDTDPSVGLETGDTDGDATVGACDINGEGNNPQTAGYSAGLDVDTDGLSDAGFGGWDDNGGRAGGDDVWAVGQDFEVDDPPGDWNGDGCPGICNVDDDGNTTIDEGNAVDDDEDGTDNENNFVGDGFLNGEDNCPALPDVDVDGDTNVDFQADSDGDGVGDPCDKAPNIPGDGRGYVTPAAGTLHDHDRVCNDPFTIGSVEGAGGGTCKDARDSNDDGVPDLADLNGNTVYDAGEYDVENHDNPDYDGDTVIDAEYTFTSTDYESDGCETWKATDPLDPTSNSGTGSATKWDCDGDTLPDTDTTLAEYDGGSYDLHVGELATNEKRAQGFKPSAATGAGSLVTVSVRLRQIGNPTDNLTLTIQTNDVNNKPSGAIVSGGTANQVSGSAISGTFQDVVFRFAQPPEMLANTQYWIVVGRTGANSATQYYIWQGNDAGTYADGVEAVYNSGGPTWTREEAFDADFKVVATDLFPFPGMADSDNDGCSDKEEDGTDQTLGGQRNKADGWDYYDVPLPVGAPGTGTRTKSIDLDDTFAVLAKFGSHPTNPPGAPPYDAAYDRSSPTPNAWNTTDPVIDNNGVQLDEVFWNLNQFGHSCYPPP